MATFRRAVTPGATYFFTVNTYRRQALLTDPPVYSALREALRAVIRAHRFTIDAFVLLPDHTASGRYRRRRGLRIALEPGETEGKPAGQALDYDRSDLITRQATGIGIMARGEILTGANLARLGIPGRKSRSGRESGNVHNERTC